MGSYSELVALYHLAVGCQDNWIRVVGLGARFACMDLGVLARVGLGLVGHHLRSEVDLFETPPGKRLVLVGVMVLQTLMVYFVTCQASFALARVIDQPSVVVVPFA